MKFKDCKDDEDFMNLFDNNELSTHHTYYYHYTSLKNIDNILKEKSIYLTPNAERNDAAENKRGIGNISSFSACFSTGTSENLPMWYLYSGIDGKGGRIGFKKKSFVELKNNSDVYLAKVEKDIKPYKILDKKILEKDDYDIICRDILYIGEDTSSRELYRSKYNGDTINKISKPVYDAIADKYSNFIKGLIWFYEKETRIQVNIKNNRLIDKNEKYIILLDISKIFNDLFIRTAPEFKALTLNDIAEFEGIKEWTLSKIEKSDFAGQIEMRLDEHLCKYCKNAPNKHLNESEEKKK